MVERRGIVRGGVVALMTPGPIGLLLGVAAHAF